MKFVKLPIARTSLPRPEAPAGKGNGPRFGHLRMGRELPKSATGKSPAIARAGAPVSPAKPLTNAAAAAERERVKAVATSEHTAGRERQALDMLATSMTAAEITALLGKMPKGSATAGNPMLARLTAQPNPQLGPGSESSGQQDAGAFWARVRASNDGQR